MMSAELMFLDTRFGWQKAQPPHISTSLTSYATRAIEHHGNKAYQKEFCFSVWLRPCLSHQAWEHQLQLQHFYWQLVAAL